MRSRVLFLVCLVLWGVCQGPGLLSAQDVQTEESQKPFASPELLVNELYEAVTFEAGTTPDWDHVRSMFLDQAVIVLRTSRSESTVFDLDGFVADFEAFIQRAKVKQTGFSERIVSTDFLEFGDVATALVLYEVTIPGSGREPQQGVDSFQMIRRDDRWWMACIVNEIPTAERPIPTVLQR